LHQPLPVRSGPRQVADGLWNDGNRLPQRKCIISFVFIRVQINFYNCTRYFTMKAQSVSAAWPHVMGILSGHIYHYYTNLSSTKHRLLASAFQVPRWFRRFLSRFGLGGDDSGMSSNVPGWAARKTSASTAPLAKHSYRQSMFGRGPILPQPKGRRLSSENVTVPHGTRLPSQEPPKSKIRK
jgi:hypothetical protein